MEIWKYGNMEIWKQAVAEVVPSSRTVQVRLRFSQLKIDKVRYTDQELDQHIKRYINNSKVTLTDQLGPTE